MADQEYVNPLDVAAAAEEAELGISQSADLAPGLQQQHSVVTGEDAIPSPAPAETPTASPAETPPTPEPAPPPPPPTEPPAVESPPVAAHPDAEPPKETPEWKSWQRAREEKRAAREAREELQRERERIASLEAEKAALRAQLQQQQQPQDEYAQEVDPQVALQQRMEMLEEQLRERRVTDAIVQQETRFRADHPDYDKALEYLVTFERRAAEETGQLDVVADRVRTTVPDQVRQLAVQKAMTEAEAARDLAAGYIFLARRQELVEGSTRTGKALPESVYALAKMRGYQGVAQTPAPVQSPAPPPQNLSAAEQQRARQFETASTTLSTMTTSAAPVSREITSRKQLGSLPPAEQERLIIQYDTEAAQGKRPLNWHENLTD